MFKAPEKRPVNPELNAPFLKGTSNSRAPFFGMPLTRAEKMKMVVNGAPDGRSGWPIVRQEDPKRVH